MNWINVEDELPSGKGRIRCLALCETITGEATWWTGIVDVYFNRSKGWARYETEKMDVRVKYWIPFPNTPSIQYEY